MSILARILSILEELLELYWSFWRLGVEFVRVAAVFEMVVTYLEVRWLLTRCPSSRFWSCLVDFLGLKFTCESLETLEVTKAILFLEILPVS